MANELLFRGAPLLGQPIELVFGADDDGGGSTPAPRTVGFSGSLPGLGGTVGCVYVSGAARPTVGEHRVSWQRAGAVNQPMVSGWQRAAAAPHVVRATGGGVARTDSSVSVGAVEAQRTRSAYRARQDDALHRQSAPTAFVFENGTARRRTVAAALEQAIRRSGHALGSWFQDGYRDRRAAVRTVLQQGTHLQQGTLTTGDRARSLHEGIRTRYQQAMRPPIGITRYVPPAIDPCYVPPHGLAIELLFIEPRATTADLVFWCERHGGLPPKQTVIVPVRKVYVVVNETTLTRVAGGVPILARSVALGLDYNSWTWTFNARVPAFELPKLQPLAVGDHVVLEVSINGAPYRVLVETVTRERGFADNWLGISGRGLNAVLDSPYSPTLNFGVPSGGLTAMQLLDHVLLDNGVPLGWTMDWQLEEDWSVPAGAWAYQGSYMAALNQIAAAAGGYLQPHATAQSMRVLPKYPTLPWDWADVEPDISLPADVAQREGTEWLEKAAYNRVFVRGERGGVLAQVTRAGSAGDIAAPMVVDPLITAGAAGRMRGASILADTGRQTLITLRMPVLDETGLILPGQFVHYHEGATEQLGLSRAMSVAVDGHQVWQTVVLETHE